MKRILKVLYLCVLCILLCGCFFDKVNKEIKLDTKNLVCSRQNPFFQVNDTEILTITFDKNAISRKYETTVITTFEDTESANNFYEEKKQNYSKSKLVLKGTTIVFYGLQDFINSNSPFYKKSKKETQKILTDTLYNYKCE